MAHLLVSATHKSSGKTTVSVGVCAALRERGVVVQPFKKGPDYIDPLWLGAAAGRDCHNLDFHTMGLEEIRATFARHSRSAELCLIEGNKGLHDGVNVDGSNSNAALAKGLNAPVVLVVDTRGMTRGIAPLVRGFESFDPEVRIAGIILNQVGGPRHEGKLRSALEHYTDIPVIGALGRSPDLTIGERHLGLIPVNETDSACAIIERIARTVAQGVDLEAIETIARSAPAPQCGARRPLAGVAKTDVRLGIARDAAFGFYYPGDLEALRVAGAELVQFDTLNDGGLPCVDGLILGGGFPETHMDALEANHALRRELRGAIASGLPVYAECGGLMYLARRMAWGDRRGEMVGAIEADVVVGERPQGRGYVVLEPTGRSPWAIGGDGSPVCAHEFHYSRLENCGPDIDFAFRVLRGHGVDGEHDGIVRANTLACYSHLRHTEATPWTLGFVDFVRSVRARRLRAAAS